MAANLLRFLAELADSEDSDLQDSDLRLTVAAEEDGDTVPCHRRSPPGAGGSSGCPSCLWDPSPQKEDQLLEPRASPPARQDAEDLQEDQDESRHV